MTEEQLRHRLAATAEEIDPSAAPLDSIRLAGRSLQRRRTRLRVAGVAATVLAAAAVALVVPTLGPGAEGPGPATTPPGPTAEPPDALLDDPAFPGLKESMENELLAAGPAQRRALEDDRVTQAEYRAGFGRYRRCLAQQGHQLGSVDHSGVVIGFVVPAAAVDSGADTTCYERHFMALDMLWQGAQSEQADDATIMRIVNDCLEASGLSPGRRPGEAVHLMIQAGLSDEECGLEPGQLG